MKAIDKKEKAEMLLVKTGKPLRLGIIAKMSGLSMNQAEKHMEKLERQRESIRVSEDNEQPIWTATPALKQRFGKQMDEPLEIKAVFKEDEEE